MKQGFSLVELLIAVGLSVLLGIMTLQALHAALAATTRLQSTQETAASLDAFEERLLREAASSDAVWVTHDATGDALHFSLIDGSGASRAWLYRFTTRIERVDTTDGATQPVAEAQGITALTATTLPASQIGTATNGLSTAFAGVPPSADALYTVDANGIAGNAVSVVTLQAGAATRVLHLLPSPVAAAFGIEQGVSWHAVVWRTASTRRAGFGLIQKSFYDVWAEVSYTNDDWATSHVWCSYDVFGPLDVGDPRARSDYYDPSETASAVFAGCQRRTGERSVPISTAGSSQGALQ